MIHQFFATSKDVSIGPVAVMCLEVANIISHVTEAYGDRWSNVQIAVTLSFICGFIVLGIGLLRIGWLVEFIPTPAVAGFMTGSAITIASSQIPGLLGIAGLFDTRASAYLVIINTLKNLKYATKDAAFGITGLFCTYSPLLHEILGAVIYLAWPQSSISSDSSSSGSRSAIPASLELGSTCL